MTDQEKKRLQKLVGEGKVQETIDNLLSLKMNESREKKILAISARNKNLKQQNSSGVLSFEDLKITENQIINSLIDLINHSDEELSGLMKYEKKQVQVILEGKLSEFTFEKRRILISTIATILEIESNLVQIKQVINGSVKVIVELPKEYAIKLMELTILGNFGEDVSTLSKGIIIIRQISLVDSEVKTNDKDSIQTNSKSNQNNNNLISKKSIWKYITAVAVIIGVLGSLAEVFNYINIFPSKGTSEKLQLTLFVTDIQGNVILEHEGELNTFIGNRSMRETIGEDGRVNFGDILPEYLGDSVTIGFKVEGWEIANGNNIFVFTGAPIHLKVKKDDSLGVIKGVIKSRDGQRFIANVKVLINSDTTVLSNESGIFKIVLPETMRVKKETDSYLLTVSKDGYKTITQYHYPKSSDAEIRLEKW